jgi:hypothetical protein
MNRIRKWLQATACPVLDWAQNERIELAARQVVKFMRREGNLFSFLDTTTLLKVPIEDLVLVKERVYELTLKHVMEDYRINERDRQGLGWIARTLKLDPKDARLIELRVGRQVFDEYLAFAISGGHLSDDEVAEFKQIADSLHITTRQLLLLFLAESGEEFLKMILDALADQQAIADADWGRFTASLAALGLDEEELIRVLRAQSLRFRENLKALSKRPPEADNQERVLKLLLDRFDRTHPLRANP